MYFVTKSFFVEASHQVRRPSPSFLAKAQGWVCVFKKEISVLHWAGPYIVRKWAFPWYPPFTTHTPHPVLQNYRQRAEIASFDAADTAQEIFESERQQKDN